MAKIDRKKCRDRFNKGIGRANAAYRKLANKTASEILKRLEKEPKTPLTEIVKDAFSTCQFSKEAREMFTDLMYRSLIQGYGGEVPEIYANADAVKARFLDAVWAPDKLKLSQRLYADVNQTQTEVRQILQTAMKRGDSLVSMSRQLYDGYGFGGKIDRAKLPKYLADLEREARHILSGGDQKSYLKALNKAKAQIGRLKQGTPLRAAYNQLVSAAERGKDKYIRKAVHAAMEEKSRYHAMRIARTEASRAYYEGFRKRNDGDTDVAAYRWTLSSAHGGHGHCECEVHAEQDNGLGPGVYRKNECPDLPAHPHCMCHLAEVYISDLPKELRAEFEPEPEPKPEPEPVKQEEPRIAQVVRDVKPTPQIEKEVRIEREVSDKSAEYIISKGRPLKEADLKKITDELKKLLASDDVRMVTMIQGKHIPSVLAAGRLKSQFETGKSGGTLGGPRPTYERDTMGLPLNLDPAKRPIYGLVVQAKSSKDIYAHAYHKAGGYGNVAIVYKNDIKRYATFTGGDSLGSRHMLIPSPLLDPSADSITPHSLHAIRRDMEKGTPPHAERLGEFGVYTEVQIHGGQATLENIDEIVYPKGTKVGVRTVKALEEAGVKWRVEK